MPDHPKEDVMNALRRSQTVGLERVNPHTGYAVYLPGSDAPSQPKPPQDAPTGKDEPAA